jgi:hypothetical protein
MKDIKKPAIAVLILTLAILALSILSSASAVWGN